MRVFCFHVRFPKPYLPIEYFLSSSIHVVKIVYRYRLLSFTLSQMKYLLHPIESNKSYIEPPLNEMFFAQKDWIRNLPEGNWGKIIVYCSKDFLRGENPLGIFDCTWNGPVTSTYFEEAQKHYLRYQRTKSRCTLNDYFCETIIYLDTQRFISLILSITRLKSIIVINRTQTQCDIDNNHR